MKGTLIVLALLFLTGQVAAASRAFFDRMRRHKGLREEENAAGGA